LTRCRSRNWYNLLMKQPTSFASTLRKGFWKIT
jgi:hypothetical protein